MSDTTVYCDRIAWRSVWGLVRRVRELGVGAPVTLHVLDAVPTGWSGRLLCRFVRLVGITVEEQPFQAGHLRLPDGMLAERVGADWALEAAPGESVRLVAGSPILDDCNRRWGRDTVRLHLCKSIVQNAGAGAMYGYAVRVACANALSLERPPGSVLLIEQSAVFDPSVLNSMAPTLSIVRYGAVVALLAAKTDLLRQWIRAGFRWLRGRWACLAERQELAALRHRGESRSGLLLLQEDDLSLDRSYRGQPHWILPEDPPTAYDTYILASPRTTQVRHERDELGRVNIHVLSDAVVLGLATASRGPTVAQLRRDARRCFWAGWRSTSAPETHALAMLARLLLTAGELTGVCQQLRIRSFMTSENHLLAGDAMNLIGDPLAVRTVSYQYSNLGTVSPLMLSTADMMLMFAPAYHPYWTLGPIRPKAFVDVGYVFDASFARVRVRAVAARERLAAAGAAFVIAYFDESVTPHKYALTSPADHCGELGKLLDWLLADSTAGLVTKVQFQKNSPSRFPELRSLVEAARATGRYLELSHGVRRNVVFPAEAAMAADLTMGHAIGGAAPLEAALTGARAIILNPYRMRDGNHEVYRRADILIENMDAALEAVEALRRGRRPGLGDWAPVLDHFDPYRDGGAGHRVRAVLDYLMSDASTVPGLDLAAAARAVCSARARPVDVA